MVLTRQARSPSSSSSSPSSSTPPPSYRDVAVSPRRRRDPRAFPTTQLALLALVRVAEPIALTSIQPYAWKLVLSFHVCERNEASFYAGILVAAFAFAESLTAMMWGSLSDKVGRKPILLLGCCGTILSLLLVGLSTNFWMALLGRALGGLLNGNIGVIQTMVGELVKLPEHEPRAFAVMPFVWSIGTIIGPAIGGYFSQPSENFPKVFPSDGIFGRHPYLLPNLICACLLFVGIVAGVFLIEETHPGMQPYSVSEDWVCNTAETPILATAGAMDDAPANLRNESYGTFNAACIEREDQVYTCHRTSSVSSSSSPAAPWSKVFTRPVVMLTIALGIFTYHSMTYDSLLPIYLQDTRSPGLRTSTITPSVPSFSGGLGLSLQQVGMILSINGVIALFIQGIIFPAMASYFGVWKLFIFVTVFHPIVYFIVPFLSFIPSESAYLYPGIYSCLSIRNFFSILAYPVLLILIKDASPSPSHLGRINGLAASTGAACRTIACPLAGYLYTLGSDANFTALAWWSSGLVAITGGVQALDLQRKRKQMKGIQQKYVVESDAKYFDEHEAKSSDCPAESDR